MMFDHTAATTTSKGVVMKRFMTAAAFVIAAAAAAGYAPTAIAQQGPAVRNSNVVIEYIEPPYQQLFERLKRRQVLEELSEVLAPLRLNQQLKITTVQCGIVNADYNFANHTIRLCYEIMNMIENEAAVPRDQIKRRSPDPNIPLGLLPGVTRGEAIVGGIVGVALHEIGHAVFDIQKIPRLGREEDAADQIAAYVMMGFGTDVSRTMIKGTYNLWHDMYAGNPKFDATRLADVHSLAPQRAINYLCLAYGKDRAAFQDLANAWLPEDRRDSCEAEYHQADIAFKKTILPWVDLDLLKKVQSMKVLRPEDLR